MEIDLHGYHPDDVDFEDLLKQAWETGASAVKLIHGHGRNRGKSPGFVNTNTGFLGLQVRRFIRNNRSLLKSWVKISTLDCSHAGFSTVSLQVNPAPSRETIVMPPRTWPDRGAVSR